MRPTIAHSLCLGIEIGGTKLQVGVGNEHGQLLHLERRAIDPARGAPGILDQIEEIVPGLMHRAGQPDAPLAAIGIGFGGPVDTECGIVLESHQIKGWTGFPIADWARRTFHTPNVALQNDADTAGLGEAISGAGRGCSPVLYVTIGSGIGGGLIVDGKIYRGAGLGAVEIGHVWVHPTGSPPTKLEHVASGWAIGRFARERIKQGSASSLRSHPGGLEAITGADVATAAQNGDTFALSVLARAREAMTEALAHAITLFAPQRVILGGGVSLLPPALWIDPIREALPDWVFPQFRQAFEVVTAQLGEEVVVHGALALAADAFSNSRTVS